jgi:hypothetical protein
MKLKLFRQSGEPVDLEAREAFKADFKAVYDKAAERAGLDMLKLSRMLSFCERQLVKKHNGQVEHDIPKSQKAWAALIAKYEDTPIMLARTTDGKSVVMILMDTLQG